MSGPAPLLVRFAFSTPSDFAGGPLTVDFGDNSSERLTPSARDHGVSFLLSHTYTSQGVYTANVRDARMCVPKDCNVVASVTITVH
jgi:hypothetical protein